MGRRLVTGMYRNAFKHERSIQYERAYRLCNAEFIRDQKEKRGPFKRITEWWKAMYPKRLPGKYRPRMAKDHS